MEQARGHLRHGVDVRLQSVLLVEPMLHQLIEGEVRGICPASLRCCDGEWMSRYEQKLDITAAGPRDDCQPRVISVEWKGGGAHLRVETDCAPPSSGSRHKALRKRLARMHRS